MKHMTVKRALKYTFGGILSLVIILFILSWFVDIENKEQRGAEAVYPSFLCLNNQNKENIYKIVNITEIAEPSMLTDSSDYCGYDSKVLNWEDTENNEITFKVDMDKAGDFYIGLDYLSLNDTIVDNSISIFINGALSNNDSENISLKTLWMNETNERTFDIYNNQTLIRQVPVDKWEYTILRNRLLLDNIPLTFNLQKGENEITIVKEYGKLLLGNIYIIEPSVIDNYESYINKTNGKMTSGKLITLEAEKSAYKNDVSIRYEVEKSPNVHPYSSDINFINIVGNYYKSPGQKITYAFNVEETGFYHITLKYKNDVNKNVNAYRNIFINDQLIFNELQSYEFPYSDKWKNETLGNGSAYQFYLEKGINTISIEVDMTYFKDAYMKIQELMDEITDLSLKVKKLTGGIQDSKREWDLNKYLPEAEISLATWENEVEEMIEDLKVINTDSKKSNEFEKKLINVLSKLKELNSNPNKLPNKMNIFSEGSSSILKNLTVVSEQLIANPLLLDRIYVHSSNVNLPSANSNFLRQILAFMQRLTNIAKPDQSDDEVVEIWVNRSRLYIELMQQMVDANFTKNTGIKVKLSVMPNEQKLILANAAGTQPDVAMGISGWIPYEIGLRGAAADLRQLDGFYELINNFEPGSLLHMIHDDKVYGLPETQDFNVIFYRKDILESLNLEVPETYDDIIAMLPTLQRYGMNFYLPLSADSALKPISATAPFIYQFGGNIYSVDAFSTDLDSEASLKALNTMIEFYTLYSLDASIPNFYEYFRNGKTPIGIGNFTTYVQLLFAAPEIKNKWDIALAPGVIQEDGSINRTNIGTAQSVMIFEKSKKKDEAFEFLKWWLSTDVQSQFTYDLQLIYGEEFIWNSANLEAFKSLPISKDHVDTILEQWHHLHEVPKTPGGYIIEREISNTWNKVVFNAISLPIALDDSLIIIERELERKYQEFGYLDKDGNVIKPYILPNIETVRQWQKMGKE